MDIVEPQRPDSGRQVGIESDCRGRSGTIVMNESRKEKENEINMHMQKLNHNQILADRR